jgi:hypothetical protein
MRRFCNPAGGLRGTDAFVAAAADRLSRLRAAAGLAFLRVGGRAACYDIHDDNVHDHGVDGHSSHDVRTMRLSWYTRR